MKGDAEEGWSKRTQGMGQGQAKWKHTQRWSCVSWGLLLKNCFVDGDHHSDTVSVYIYRCWQQTAALINSFFFSGVVFFCLAVADWLLYKYEGRKSIVNCIFNCFSLERREVEIRERENRNKGKKEGCGMVGAEGWWESEGRVFFHSSLYIVSLCCQLWGCWRLYTVIPRLSTVFS